jgi:putative NADPH-quinone reductase
MKFDPILWKGYKVIQELEPDLKQAQENIMWCNKWVIVFPLWWGAVPALLKGFIDRTLYEGFAYRNHDRDPFWDKLLKGRSAELISTCDAPSWWVWWQYRNSDLISMKRATLKFCGVSPVKSTRISRVRFLSKEERQRRIEKICDRI